MSLFPFDKGWREILEKCKKENKVFCLSITELVQKELDLRKKVIMKLAKELHDWGEPFTYKEPEQIIQQAVKEITLKD